ncbi:pyruvate kinase [Rhodopirellula europaea]|uniref:pyruvate kinase n=1 Tax=Rhodopirellula europaea TaxID=1263866 RepID=UPI003D2D267B|tara:strand:+ start:19718 stop:20701 length:984 start_codon:yes stop_codon:yes gene_type:complete
MIRIHSLKSDSHRQARLFQVGLAFAVWCALIAGTLVLASITGSNSASAQPPIAKAAWGVDSGVVRLPAGLVAQSMPRDRFNQLLFLGTPKLTHGDVDDVIEVVRQNSSLFGLAIMATVVQQDGKYQLREVGLGHSYKIGKRPTIVTSEKAESLGADLGMIATRVLAKNEAMMDPPIVVIQTTSLIVFDVTAVMAINGQHVDRRMRHLIWTHPTTGRTATAVWLLNEEITPPGAKQWAIESAMPIHLIPADTVEDRAIHVDGDEISWTIPSDRAFALQRLPGKTQVSWTPALREHLGNRTFDNASLGGMLEAINDAIASATGSETQNR